jgi:hypothetical protein
VSVALGGAALRVGIDRFFGGSTAWRRFIATEHPIRQALHAFQLDVETEHAVWGGKPPQPEPRQAVLTRGKAFLIPVDTLIRHETDPWLAKFQNTLAHGDEAARAEPGGIHKNRELPDAASPHPGEAPGAQ